MHLKYKGFTLIELMIVIIIMAIMAVIALPNMSQWLAKRRVASKAEQVANLIRFARSEAIRLNVPVYICPAQIKTDGNPDKYCNNSFSGQGLVAFADMDSSKSYDRQKDIALRTVIINIPNKVDIDYQINTYNFANAANRTKNPIWRFLPNGSFGYIASMNRLPSVAYGPVRILISDKKAQNTTQRMARSSIVLIDGSGRASICTHKDTNQLCRF